MWVKSSAIVDQHLTLLNFWQPTGQTPTQQINHTGVTFVMKRVKVTKSKDSGPAGGMCTPST